jgi:asparagine synthase (glutamine-hydrolysing)
MCGIVGYVGEGTPEQGRQALATMAYRGPDGSGEWACPESRVWLGHRRLAIIDVSGGAQPLSNTTQDLWITFNGCIYNYLELRTTLTQKGYCFRTQTDTEVILNAYAEYGETCVQHFNGMFAFAIWDTRRKRLFCAVDRMGIKPFYYHVQNNSFQFASEIKALLVMQPNARQPDMAALQTYLTFQVMLDDKTLFQGIRSLRPGHTLTFEPEAQRLEIREYWQLTYHEAAERSELDYQEALYDLLQDAVRLRLRSDVPLGAHLSGGLDSSGLVGIMRQAVGPDPEIHTFTGAFDEGPAFDETPYARLVSAQAHTQNHEIFITADDFTETLQRIIYHMDMPAAGPGVLPQFLVAKAAANQVKVVLGGQGGDEIFGGYARYLVCYLEETLQGCLETGANASAASQKLAAMAPHLAMLSQYQPMLKHFWADGLFGPQESRYFRLMNRASGMQGLFSSEVFSSVAAERLQAQFNTIFYDSNATSFLNRMLHFDLKVHLPGLLHVEDRTSMAWGLESRVPFLDHRIIEFMATVPPEIKLKAGQPKYLLREAIAPLVPHQILDRTDKMGFPVPLAMWFQTKLKDDLRSILLDTQTLARGIFDPHRLAQSLAEGSASDRALWGALNIELWFRTFIDNPAEAQQRHGIQNP